MCSEGRFGMCNDVPSNYWIPPEVLIKVFD